MKKDNAYPTFWWPGCPWTVAELRTAFDELAGADWRGPIRARIKATDFEKYDAAVVFFTSTTLQVVGRQSKDGFVQVQAAGYRMGPAGP